MKWPTVRRALIHESTHWRAPEPLAAKKASRLEPRASPPLHRGGAALLQVAIQTDFALGKKIRAATMRD
jgi:hypothetical protein